MPCCRMGSRSACPPPCRATAARASRSLAWPAVARHPHASRSLAPFCLADAYVRVYACGGCAFAEQTGRGDRYVGVFAASLREGRGECTYADGSVYVGEWAAGLHHGSGTLTGLGRALSEGQWHRGEMVGAGRRVYANGEVYDGEFSQGLRHGRGVWHDEAHGARYDGEWADDMRDGGGVWTSAAGERREGNWKQDRLHGPSCRATSADGSEYEGSFDGGRRGGTQPIDLAALQSLLSMWHRLLEKQGASGTLSSSPAGRASLLASAYDEFRPRFLKEVSDVAVHGYGLLALPSGEVYEGFFRDELRTGPGLWVTADGEAEAAVPIEGDEAQGAATAVAATGEAVATAETAAAPVARPRRALGTFKAGQLGGFGMALYANGDVHVGGFVDWQPSGQGVRWLADGAVYRGHWDMGVYHGTGELRAAPARSEAEPAEDAHPASEGEAPVERLYRGVWVRGIRQGEGHADFADGSSYEGQWHADAPHGRGELWHRTASNRQESSPPTSPRRASPRLILTLILTLTLTLILPLTSHLSPLTSHPHPHPHPHPHLSLRLFSPRLSNAFSKAFPSPQPLPALPISPSHAHLDSICGQHAAKRPERLGDFSRRSSAWGRR